MTDKREVCLPQHEDYMCSENTAPSIRSLGERRRGIIGFALSDLFLRKYKVEGKESGCTSESVKTQPYSTYSPVTEWNPSPFIHILPIHSIPSTTLHQYKTGKIMGCLFSCILIPRYLERRQGDEL